MTPGDIESPEYILVTPYCGLNDPANGAVTRIEAWKAVFPQMRILASDTTVPEQIDQGKKIYICLDLTGQKLGPIIAGWRRWRGLRPVAYLQDSQARYFWTQLVFRARNLDGRAGVSIINFFRTALREFVARCVYRKVGYISGTDASFFLNNGDAVEILKPIVVKASAGERMRAPTVIGIVANFAYEPNKEGLRALFGSRSFRDTLVRENFLLRLLGFQSKEFLSELAISGEGISGEGWIDAENSGPFDNLEAALAAVDLVLNPAQYGSGVKNKMLEAVNAGKICFANNIFRGEFGYDDRNVLYFRTIEELGEQLRLLRRLTNAYPGQSAQIYKHLVRLVGFFE